MGGVLRINKTTYALNLQGAARMPPQTEFTHWGISSKPFIYFFF